MQSGAKFNQKATCFIRQLSRKTMVLERRTGWFDSWFDSDVRDSSSRLAVRQIQARDSVLGERVPSVTGKIVDVHVRDATRTCYVAQTG